MSLPPEDDCHFCRHPVQSGLYHRALCAKCGANCQTVTRIVQVCLLCFDLVGEMVEADDKGHVNPTTRCPWEEPLTQGERAAVTLERERMAIRVRKLRFTTTPLGKPKHPGVES